MPQARGRGSFVMSNVLTRVLTLCDACSMLTNYPATGRSASACTDQTHAACHLGAIESVQLDRKVEAELRHITGTY